MQLIAFRMLLFTLAESIRFLADAIFNGVNREMADRHIKCFGAGLLKMSHTSVKLVGLENLPVNQAYILMSNHASLMDIPILLGTIPGSLRMVAKQILFKVPFFGSAMKNAGFIPIDRKNLERAKEQLEIAKQKLQEGYNLCIFPEGTRSKTDELLPFKKGGFHLAIGLQAPIVPVWIDGASRVIAAKGSQITTHQSIRVMIGEPIATTGYTKDTLPELMEQVRLAMIQPSQLT